MRLAQINKGNVWEMVVKIAFSIFIFFASNDFFLIILYYFNMLMQKIFKKIKKNLF